MLSILGPSRAQCELMMSVKGVIKEREMRAREHCSAVSGDQIILLKLDTVELKKGLVK